LAPHWEKGEKLNWHKLRTIFRVVVVKYTFCRFNCFNRLKASDFTDTRDGIKIRFQSAKNDQWHKWNGSFIMDKMAVKVVRLAFHTFRLRMGDEGDNRPVNCTLQKTASGWKLDGECKLSYTNATKQLRELLAETGREGLRQVVQNAWRDRHARGRGQPGRCCAPRQMAHTVNAAAVQTKLRQLQEQHSKKSRVTNIAEIKIRNTADEKIISGLARKPPKHAGEPYSALGQFVRGFYTIKTPRIW
jgi:hypothetical protein